MDERIIKHARILVDHSTKVKAGDMVLISYSDHGLDLVKAIYALASERGASPIIQQTPTEALRSLYDLTPEIYLSRLPVHELSTYTASDVIIAIKGEENLRAMRSLDKKRLSLRAQATKPIKDVYLKKRWVVTQVPTPAYAQEAEMSMHEYEDFVFNAVLRDWRVDENKLRAVEELMEKTDEVRITGKDTDLTFSIKGRKTISDFGEHNVPWGEAFTAPVEDSANGEIYFDLPSVRYGDEARDIRLKFSKGEIVDYKASKGEDLLKAMIETDEGSHRLGEFGIGTNDNITKFTRNILFDEKMAGTIHLAIGFAYPDCHGKNQSAIHWDMIKTMKPGEVLFDGRLVMKDGVFTFMEEGKKR